MKKIKEISILFDTYGLLLSPKKQKYLANYYFDDFSLSEIAKNYKISKAAVHESIILAVKELKNYEKKLNFVEKQNKRLLLYNKLVDHDLKKELLKLESK